MTVHRRRVVLASTSKYRSALLERLGLSFDSIAPGVDEDAVKGTCSGARELVETLALAKARAAAALAPEAVIIGSDQCAALDGEILGKPGSVDNAIAQLERMSGRTHSLWTGVAVLDARTGACTVDVDQHELTMRSLTREQIAAYVDRDRPLDCAGSYKIESMGIALFESVEGRDFTAIIGLPMTLVARRLAERGVDVFDFPER